LYGFGLLMYIRCDKVWEVSKVPIKIIGFPNTEEETIEEKDEAVAMPLLIVRRFWYSDPDSHSTLLTSVVPSGQ